MDLENLCLPHIAALFLAVLRQALGDLNDRETSLQWLKFENNQLLETDMHSSYDTMIAFWKTWLQFQDNKVNYKRIVLHSYGR